MSSSSSNPSGSATSGEVFHTGAAASAGLPAGEDGVGAAAAGRLPLPVELARRTTGAGAAGAIPRGSAAMGVPLEPAPEG